MHEHSPRHIVPAEGSSDRSFGLVFAVFFLIVGLQPLLRGLDPRLWALEFSGVLIVAALFAPTMLTSFNRLWMKLGLLMHGIVSPIALAILFYGVVTPTGLIMRLFGKDPLRLAFDRDAVSYWIERNPPGPDAESLKNQF